MIGLLLIKNGDYMCAQCRCLRCGNYQIQDFYSTACACALCCPPLVDGLTLTATALSGASFPVGRLVTSMVLGGVMGAVVGAACGGLIYTCAQCCNPIEPIDDPAFLPPAQQQFH